ncbi:MAG TPA: hypothetical protein DGF10_08905 [Acidimicrobiaceae bacterium]|nr:hypothetical protein [Acidimicrobiaceae bacterium]HCV34768.1 hypothetical protein [Acidimicrobiaceae bacterium]
MTEGGNTVGTVLVAPREVLDLVYRCARVAGLDTGSADRAARNVTAAEVGYGSALGVFCQALGDSGTLKQSFVDGPDVLAIAEVKARLSGSAEARLPAPTPVAALALVVDEIRGRGLGVSGIPDDADGCTMVDRLAVGGPAQLRTVDSVAHTAASREGVRVDAIALNQATEFAHGFLVPEAILDAAEI